MSLTVRIGNPFALREGLLCAIEATEVDMPADQVEALRRFARSLPQGLNAVTVVADFGLMLRLVDCVRRFDLTRICYWLREDLREALDAVKRDFGTLQQR